MVPFSLELAVVNWVRVVQFLILGWYVGFCIVGGIAAGIILDLKLGTGPLLAITGLLLGVILAFFGLYRMVKSIAFKD